MSANIYEPEELEQHWCKCHDLPRPCKRCEEIEADLERRILEDLSKPAKHSRWYIDALVEARKITIEQAQEMLRECDTDAD